MEDRKKKDRNEEDRKKDSQKEYSSGNGGGLVVNQIQNSKPNYRKALVKCVQHFLQHAEIFFDNCCTRLMTHSASYNI